MNRERKEITSVYMTTRRKISATLRVLQQLLDEGRNMVSNGTAVKRV